jgi:2-(1,2-epoxy-1,2-dihydrophenyl)acetyl-CoA isomerase
MKDTELVLEEEKGRILYVTLNRPEKLNCLIEPMRERLAGIIQSLASRKDIHGCVITGAGRGFCAGGDINIMQTIIQDSDFDRIQQFLKWGRAIVLGIRSLPIPVIAAVNGPAAGAGMNLALACDVRLVSSKATFGQTFINIGLHPDWGGTYLLPSLTNPSTALDMFWSGRVISAEDAHRIGIANQVIDHDIFMERVAEYADDLASKSRLVIQIVKRNVYEGAREKLEIILSREEAAQADCIQSGAAREGMRRFLEKRKKTETSQ